PSRSWRARRARCTSSSWPTCASTRWSSRGAELAGQGEGKTTPNGSWTSPRIGVLLAPRGRGPGARGRHVDLHARRAAEGHREMDGAAGVDRVPLRLLANHAVDAGAALRAPSAMGLRGLVPRVRPGDRLDDRICSPRPVSPRAVMFCRLAGDAG